MSAHQRGCTCAVCRSYFFQSVPEPDAGSRAGWCQPCREKQWAQASSRNEYCATCKEWFCPTHAHDHAELVREAGSNSTAQTWRVGRKVGRTIYEGDLLIGTMDTPELAREVVDAVNRARAVR